MKPGFLSTRFTRRSFLAGLGATATLPILAACQPQIVEKVVERPVEVVVTREVEKIVEKEMIVEKPVEVMVEVTREVEKIVEVERQTIVEVEKETIVEIEKVVEVEKVVTMVPPMKPEMITIAYQAMGVAPFFPAIDEVITAFEDAYAGTIMVDRHFVAKKDNFRVLNQFRSGNAEDLSYVDDDDIFFLTAAGAITILDPYIDRDLNRDDWHPRAWNARPGPGGQVANITVGGKPIMYMYNKGIMEEAGIKMPENYADAWTLDEWEENFRKLTIRKNGTVEQWAGNYHGCYSNTWLPLTGVDPYNADETAAQYNHPDIVALFERIMPWMLGDEPIALPRGNNAGELFNAGKLAITGGQLKSAASIPEDIDFDFMPYPIVKRGIDVPVAGGVSDNPAFLSDETYAIPSTTKWRDEAWELGKWFLGEVGQWGYARSDMIFPALKKVYQSEEYLNQPFLANGRPLNRIWAVETYTNGWRVRTDNPMGSIYASTLCVNGSKMDSGKLTVQEFLDDATKQANGVIGQYKWSKALNEPGWRLPGVMTNTGYPTDIPSTSGYGVSYR
jgi:maltose-binding protein MalE